MKKIITSIGLCMLIAGIAISTAAKKPKADAGPTTDSALAADDELTKALRDDDADGIARLLSNDWAVISARGVVGEGKSIFPIAIKSGRLKHTAYEALEPRVRPPLTAGLHNAGASKVGAELNPTMRWRSKPIYGCGRTEAGNAF